MSIAISLGAIPMFRVGNYGDMFLLLTLIISGINVLKKFNNIKIYLQGLFLMPIMESCNVIKGT